MKYTIREIFEEFSDKYLEKYKPSYEQKKALNRILDCRTEKLGTRIYQCDECGTKVFTYNSCKDRHCPSCQSYKKEVWIDSHKDDILDITYFHIVLDVPEELRPIFYHNQVNMYNLLFKMSSETIMELCEDEKYLGVKVGITSMLHTWSQKGNYFPHIHMVVTGGGIDKLGRWIDCKGEELLSTNVIAKKFKKKLLDGIRKLDGLKCYGDYEFLNNRDCLNRYLDKLYDKEWISYSKPPFKNVGEIYEYLGKYAFRVCMSNERIEKIENGYVYFNYKDYRDRNIKRVMKLKGEEFIRKFLFHVLPDSFMKIRYYGLFAGRDKISRMNKLKILTKTRTIKEKYQSKIEILNKIVGRDVTKCRECEGTLCLICSNIPERSPPNNIYLKENLINA